MTKSGKTLLLLGLIQALHSSEEILFHLHDFTGRAAVRVPAFFPQFIRSGVSPEIFSVLNIMAVAALLATVPFFENRRPWAGRMAWIAAEAEALNGFFHPAAAVVLGRYVPGAASGPFLLLTASVLLFRLRRDRGMPRA
ncbi:MAG: HXXEE domain-containing protein [bacterium]|nr:HXXEE domain-containing protein [bacterium]